MTATTTHRLLTAWHRLAYRGPSIDVLHSDYARQGRIDTNSPVSASDSLIIDAPIERVWEVLSQPTCWGTIDPDIHDVVLDTGVIEGARFTWRNGKTRLRSRFAVVDDGRELSWTGTAFGAKAVHRHVLSATDDGRTRLFSEESMAGPPLVLFFSSTKLAAALEHWLTAVAAAAETEPATDEAMSPADWLAESEVAVVETAPVPYTDRGTT